MQFLCDGKCIVAADRNQRVDLVLAMVSMQRSKPSGRLEGLVREVRRMVPPRGRMPLTASRSSSMLLSSIRPRQPSMKSHELVLVVEHSFAHDRADHRVQSRTIAPAS